MGNQHTSFGRTTLPTAKALTADEAIALMKSGTATRNAILPYGNGRSYGDSCQNNGGAIVDMRSMNKILSFDEKTGILVAESGALLCDIIAYAAPHGFFPAVVPGTQFVTLGGAIANDVHGKNHHRRGTFGYHVEELRLLRSDGRTHVCSPMENARLYWGAIGGMGLTGIILSASIKLMKVSSLDIDEVVTPFSCLDAYLDVAEAADAENEYAVAWIDQLAAGRGAGRGLLLTGNHAQHGSRQASGAGRQLAVPFQPPVNLLNRAVLTAFNAAYRWKRGRSTGPEVTPYQKFFFPLDSVSDWNRLYGPKGLFQHQSVIPHEAARATLPLLLAEGRKAGQGSFLTVLKRFGTIRSPGMLSFPRPGYTLTLDFPNRGDRTMRLLRELDAIAVGAGGAVNPYKDARMSASTFSASFPDWQRLELIRDHAFMSDFWARTAKRLETSAGMMLRAAE